MSSLGSITIKGKSGSGYSFDLYRMGQSFKALGAVYVILELQSKDGSPWYRYIYVGETGDLSTRFDSHHKQKCFDKESADRIGIHLQSSEKTRTSIEDDILQGGTWPCND